MEIKRKINGNSTSYDTYCLLMIDIIKHEKETLSNMTVSSESSINVDDYFFTVFSAIYCTSGNENEVNKKKFQEQS